MVPVGYQSGTFWVPTESVSAFTLTQIKKSNKMVPNLVPKGVFLVLKTKNPSRRGVLRVDLSVPVSNFFRRIIFHS